MNRRNFLTILALSFGACAGVGAVGGLAGLLLARRRYLADQSQAEQAIAHEATLTPVPTVTAAPPAILPRKAWNARAVNHNALRENGFASASNPYGWLTYEGDLATIYRTAAIHHSYPIRRDTGTMREIQDLHMDKDQWADIGYHYGIDGKGNIYEGRDIRVRGASVAGYNTGTIGIVVIGDFEQESPAPIQLSSLGVLLKWLKTTYHITHLAGHFEFNPESVCPGAAMRPLLDGIARNTNLLRGTGGYVIPTPMS